MLKLLFKPEEVAESNPSKTQFLIEVVCLLNQWLLLLVQLIVLHGEQALCMDLLRCRPRRHEERNEFWLIRIWTTLVEPHQSMQTILQHAFSSLSLLVNCLILYFLKNTKSLASLSLWKLLHTAQWQEQFINQLEAEGQWSLAQCSEPLLAQHMPTAGWNSGHNEMFYLLLI